MEVSLLDAVDRLKMPARHAVKFQESGFSVQSLFAPEKTVAAAVSPYKNRGANCRRAVAETADGERYLLEFGGSFSEPDEAFDGIIRGHASVENGLLTFERAHFRDESDHIQTAIETRKRARSAWRDGIRYQSESMDEAGNVTRQGIRLPQAGALHAIAAHWTLTEEPAIVVMPTGTGKTEVMLAATVAAPCERLLVVVPSDPLRTQTADKFATYGILKEIGVIPAYPNPVVGTLASAPAALQFSAIESCNVVVTTMSAIGLAEEETQKRFARLFSHIFFDEAHHVEAATWKRFQLHCRHAKTLLFTATPFREDGKPLQGRIIYNFSLSAAQEQGFFQPIRFREVFEPNMRLADRRIADEAVKALREDLAAGHDHFLMARADTIESASKLFADIYDRQYSDLNPVLIHSRTPGRRKVLDAIKNGRHRIIVCVDMFGEGFDLPNLKVAALHATHKSLGITLQFIGRFARSARNVGRATFVANTAEDGVPEALESLFFEDADWNVLLADLSYDAIDPKAKLSQLVSNLKPVGRKEEQIEISALALRPKTSAQVYRTASFSPGHFAKAFRPSQRVHQPQISLEDRFLILIVNQHETLDWTDSREILVDSWDLFIAYHDEERQLLYIHSSRKGDAGGKLARAISHDPVLIREEEVFKAFSGLRRLVLHSVGLTSRSRNVRYQMFAGLDVRNAIDPVEQQSKMKSNVTGVGYEEGRRRSVGCSRKGKIWSLNSGSIVEWKMWCDEIGAKLSDAHATPNDFLKYTLIPSAVPKLPATPALLVDWPDQLFESANFRFEVVVPDQSFGFHDCELELGEWGADSFSLILHAGVALSAELRLQVVDDGEQGGDGYKVELLSGPAAEIDAFGTRQTVTEFFQANPPLVRLADGSQMAGNILLKPREELPDTYDRDLIQVLPWTGVDLTKESRWKDGAVRSDSIQQYFIEHLERGSATFIIDDDDTGESADVVAIEEGDVTITVHLWHCKYSGGPAAGRRADDLFVVCGQAQKSVKWTWNLKTLINHLSYREGELRRGRPSRFIRGSLEDLVTLRKSARRKFIEYRIGIVQPGLYKDGMPAEHLALLGATSSFIQTITGHPLVTVASGKRTD